MDQKLAELVQRKQKQAGAGGKIDWDERRDRYIAAVKDLYKQIQAILGEPIDQKAVSLQEREKQLVENYIGAYSINDLILLIGDEQVRFSPRGRNIAGAEGRVDVIGEKGEAILVLLPDSKWGFVQSRQPKVAIVPFAEATLAEVLRLVMRD